MAEALVLKEDQYLESYDELDQLTKAIRLKYNRLNEGKAKLFFNIFTDLMSYLRAHCLVLYEGSDFQRIKMTEATVLDFEILVLNQYLKIIQLFESNLKAKGMRDYHDEERTVIESSISPWREKFISTYRASHMKIVQDQS